jgi:hypothetical protein
MATTYTWKIAQLERETEDNFVFTAHWTVNAIEITGDKQYSAGSYGSIGFQRPENLVPFEELDEELVVSWVQEAIGEEQVETMEAALDTQIAEQKAPTKAQGLPWAQNSN